MLVNTVLPILLRTTGLGVLIGLILIITSYVLSRLILVPDLTKRLDDKGLRNPDLIKLIVRGSYLVIATGCFTIVLSLGTALASIVMLIANGKFWFCQ